MSAPPDTHQNHIHRYAHSHHGNQMDAEEIATVTRNKATTCEHRFIHVSGSAEQSLTTESHADLIAHLEQQSLNWVKKFTTEINGGNGGLKQKFVFKLDKRQLAPASARDNPDSGIAILEKFGS